MPAFDWLRINNKRSLRLSNRFAQREFFKFVITKDTLGETNEVAAILTLLNQIKCEKIC